MNLYYARVRSVSTIPTSYIYDVVCVYPGTGRTTIQSNHSFFFLKKRNSKTLTTDRCWGSRFLKVDCHVSVAAGKILHDRSVVVINGTGSKSLSASFVACVVLVGIPPIFSFSFCLSLRLDIRLL